MKILVSMALTAALAIPAAAAGGDAQFSESLSGAAAAPAAQPPLEGTIVADKTTSVKVDLNAKTVKCSAADYSGPMLKVLVPALAGLTVLNHRNTREGAPCLAAGRCGGLGPDAILKSGEGVDRIPVRVVLKKLASLEGDVCRVTLVETVTTEIRGVAFTHERFQEVADRAADDCR